ncbi:MAG: radical SAM protein [Clostridiaceae bacterium]
MEYIKTKSILTPVKKSDYWFDFDYGMNIYRGCSHGCIYCDSRSDCYGVDDFDTVKPKADVIAMLRTELKTKRKTGIIGTGAMSDPYNPLEKKLELTRKALEEINANNFGVFITTKSSLVTRDIDILKKINETSTTMVSITITSSDDKLSKKIEPRVSSSSERFKALKELSDAGIFTGVLFMPVLPFIEDNEENVINMVRLASMSGARFIYPMFGVTLRSNQKTYFYQQLDKEFPGIKEKYINQYKDSYYCESPKAKQLSKLFEEECKKANLLFKMKDINSEIRQNHAIEQLSLFDI